jgi:hypothetical protein
VRALQVDSVLHVGGLICREVVKVLLVSYDRIDFQGDVRALYIIRKSMPSMH